MMGADRVTNISITIIIQVKADLWLCKRKALTDHDHPQDRWASQTFIMMLPSGYSHLCDRPAEPCEANAQRGKHETFIRNISPEILHRTPGNTLEKKQDARRGKRGVPMKTAFLSYWLQISFAISWTRSVTPVLLKMLVI
jgi:hypothetical protein